MKGGGSSPNFILHETEMEGFITHLLGGYLPHLLRERGLCHIHLALGEFPDLSKQSGQSPGHLQGHDHSVVLTRFGA